MGNAFATRFAAAGMKIVLADIEGPRLDAAVAALRAGGADAIGVVADVADRAAVERLFAAAVDAFGRVNVVCNNAGVGGGGARQLAEVVEPDWQWVMGVNFWGVVHGHGVFLPHLLEHGDGHIVNTASMAGHFPGHSPYSASKWAVVAITEGLYHELRGMGSTVGVSCLCPGWVNTDIDNSIRNRPEWAAPRDVAEPAPAIAAMQAFVRDQLRSGMAPAAVADLVHDAVLAGQFWVFTDMTMVARLEPRFGAVLAAENPPLLFP
jgi:NAD(P)-dependent dehydrogenase (short-subunit alcohol dehydrogenase family)